MSHQQKSKHLDHHHYYHHSRLKRRAGLFVVDSNNVVCLVLQTIPYDKSKTANTKDPQIVTLKTLPQGENKGDDTTPTTINYIYNNLLFSSVVPMVGGCTMTSDKQRRRPLLSTTDRCPAETFLEQFQIPRGIIEPDEEPITCAIREFLEETRCGNSEFDIYSDSFELFWVDDNRMWVYSIFIGRVHEPFKVMCAPHIADVNTFKQLVIHGSTHVFVIPLIPFSNENFGKYVAFMNLSEYDLRRQAHVDNSIRRFVASQQAKRDNQGNV
ncbi:hypothetical protein WDU94_012448 [Cyamophila willieti]